MSIDKEKLRSLALAATPGPWKYWGETGHEIFGPMDERGGGRAFMLNLNAKRADAEFIAAANPAAVLELIAEVKMVKEENDSLRKDAQRYRSQFGDYGWDYSDRWVGCEKPELDALIDSMTKENAQ